ncbi:TLG2-vesicle protein of 38 kDa [Cordyceps fumosorosea ARSEF 2679]|uniref:Golgi apparatus membrane protein TVP38 n=1 Tax=Cordyceps fumosorosea (strain ARSEF 2679) TaxID=1081104 RepID=A0A168B188_CORFA|nr:TLG2-vesicle protein of 38 kDa [Cordyceps fumosorosea ARSEF 2679]OAA69476.1 TLG2-vesicle protein of 38 kDa [Cordyceps fumosorosea ARSEF 2679]
MPRSPLTHMRPSSTSTSPSPSPPLTSPRWSSSSRLSPSRQHRLSRGRNRRASTAASGSVPSPSAPTPSSLLSQAASLARHALDLGLRVLAWYLRLPLLPRLLLALAALAVGLLALAALVYSHALFAWLGGPVADRWRRMPAGWLVNFALVFVTSFPPVVGYATATTIAGFIWGFPGGWPVAAAAATTGSLAAFVASRTVLGGFVGRLVGRDPRFLALAQVMRKEGLLYLTAVRFCPLPFSLSNGFLATIPSITPAAFTISTALSSVKLLVHVFIGSRLAILFEKGDEMSTRDKVINWTAMGLSGVVGLAVGYVIYRRTMERAAEIAREQTEGAAGTDDEDAAERGYAAGGYVDSETALLDPEDAAAIMSDDDLSLWETNGATYSDEESGGSGSDGARPKSNGLKLH